MILFSHLRTKRLAVSLRELTLEESIGICKLPAERLEATTTEFLKFAASKAEAPQKQYVTDPRLWTVQERARVVCHYLSHVADDAPDFGVGAGSNLSDYVTFDADVLRMSVSMGEIAGETWTASQLLGIHAEILERCCSIRGDWIIGAMAMQITADGEAATDWASLPDTELLETAKRKIATLKAMPESDFERLLFAYSKCTQEMGHFFDINFDDVGILFDARKEAGNKTPARFRAISCIGQTTRRLFG